MTIESIKPKSPHGRGIAIGLMLLGLALSACDMSARSDRVRITATVDVNGVLYSGSAVQQYNCRDGIKMARSMDSAHCSVSGEAVVVDLKERGYLFLLLKGTGDTDLTSLTRGMLHAENNNGGDNWTLMSNEMPMMVTFKDTKDPKSVVLVDPEHLDATFGKGVSLKQVEVKYANFSSLTHGQLEKVLPWIVDITTMLDGERIISSTELASTLSRTYFISGAR